MSDHIQTPKYTMGTDAPFNFFYTPDPTPMGGYHAATGANQDPFPFKMSGQSIQSQPAGRSTIVNGPQNGQSRSSHG